MNMVPGETWRPVSRSLLDHSGPCPLPARPQGFLELKSPFQTGFHWAPDLRMGRREHKTSVVIVCDPGPTPWSGLSNCRVITPPHKESELRGGLCPMSRKRRRWAQHVQAWPLTPAPWHQPRLWEVV